MNKLTVCITTFKQRYNLVCNLLSRIREIDNEVDIIVAVNGNNEEHMDEEYRTNILNVCKDTPNCYPIVCPEFKSLAKLWNTCVIFSNTNYNLILNDDIVIHDPKSLEYIKQAINTTDHQAFTINWGYSHFVVTKQLLHEIGYFDERLIAFGEEDGDFVHRFITKYNKKVPILKIQGMRNIAAYEQSDTKTENHIHNKPKINREILWHLYSPDPNGAVGMFHIPYTKVDTGMLQYPYEMFFLKNKHNIKKFDKVIMEYT